MRHFSFETVDVFTEQRFGGNPLAVFPNAAGLTDREMQSLAFEFNLSETTFVLPPADPQNTARVRIFNRTTEMAFAGHPSIGTAYVIARSGVTHGDRLRLEVPAGIVPVDLERDEAGAVVGGKLEAPQPLSIGPTFPVETIAACVGLSPADIVVSGHKPVLATVGNPYVFAQVTDEALSRCVPDISAFRRAIEGRPELNGRFSIHLYAGDGCTLRARMFAPLAGTVEDPATGSANAPLGALLLHVSGERHASYTINQGVEMGRPSTLHVTASRNGNVITATVAGRCVPVMRGEVLL